MIPLLRESQAFLEVDLGLKAQLRARARYVPAAVGAEPGQSSAEQRRLVIERLAGHLHEIGKRMHRLVPRKPIQLDLGPQHFADEPDQLVQGNVLAIPDEIRAAARLGNIGGEEESLGRPYLYDTTKKFLELFGLRSLDELPMASRLRKKPQTPTPEEQPAEVAEADVSA